MMKTNKITLMVMGLALVSLFASCKKDNEIIDGPIDGKGFIAFTEKGGNTRTHGVPGDGNIAIHWTENDAILVANQSGDTLTYMLSEGKDSTEGTFESERETDEFLEPNYAAIYPAKNAEGVKNNITVTSDGITATINLPATQEYLENSFAEKSMPMVSYSESQVFKFKNVLGGLCFPIKGEGTVTKIELTTDANEALWGVCTTAVSTSGGDPSSEMTYNDAAQKTITLDCGAEGIVLGSTPVDFYIMVPAGTLESGFTVKAYNGTEVIYEKSTASAPGANFISRNQVRKVNGSLTVVVENNAPAGAIDGVFSVGANKKVYFSQGNLQYIGSASTPYWKFADHQWDYFEASTGQYSDAMNVDRDLIGWGATGFDNTANDPYATRFQPWETAWSPAINEDYNLFGYGPSTNQSNPDLTGSNYDWGVYNDIRSGENIIPAGTYRTLSSDEWDYLLNSRSNHANLCGEGSVDGVNGLIFLPDAWTTPPADLSFIPGSVAFENAYTVEEWMQMEAAGAVFLPLAGVRLGEAAYNDNIAVYHTATHYDHKCPYYMMFLSGGYGITYDIHSVRAFGASIRLVIDKTSQPVQIPAKAFSVANGSYVWFSPGNLQATSNDMGATWTWSFAAHQYDRIGETVANNTINNDGTLSSNGTVDLFGWSTSATNYGINGSFQDGDYSGSFVDWSNVSITNGGNYQWRTLNASEWQYLFESRTNCGDLYGYGTIDGVEGLIVLPDMWELPSGATFSVDHSGWNDNTYTVAQWTAMENNGAIFFPAAGYRDEPGYYDVGELGGYWSCTADGTEKALGLAFVVDGPYVPGVPNAYVMLLPNYSTGRSGGCSVRLARTAR